MSQEHEAESLAEGSLISHLVELRDRLLRAVITVTILSAPCIYFSNELFELIARPLIQQLPDGSRMIATNPISTFMAPLKLSILTALFIAIPVVLYQIWAFVAPGLYRHEKRFAIPLVVSSIVLFYAGATFAYFVVFPLMFEFLTANPPKGVEIATDIAQYLDFVVFLFFAFGAAFEIPVATVLLAASGLVKIETMTKNRGYVVIGIFIVAAFLTPPDALSQSFMAVPMYLLYECGIIMSRILLKERLARKRAEEAAARAEEEQNASG
jgi:sec-independent protein translocase protein TatC